MVNNNIPNILSEKIKKARIAKGLEIQELANSMCLSIKHIVQIEEGGDSAFFSKSHKVQVAKKVGTYLGLSEDQIIDISDAPSTGDVEESLPTMVDISAPNEIQELEKLGNQNLESKSYQKFGLIATLCVATVAAILYLSLPLELDKKPEGSEPVNRVEEPLKAELKAIDTTPAPLVAPSSSCDINPENVTAFKVSKANSAGNFIYLVSRAQQSVCVIDAKNNKQLVQLAELEKKNIIGVPPFTILSPDFKQLDIYYQGWKVPVTAGTTTVRTEEQSIKSEALN
jgi:transcriptional regulator with XRE-family HTH domain